MNIKFSIFQSKWCQKVIWYVLRLGLNWKHLLRWSHSLSKMINPTFKFNSELLSEGNTMLFIFLSPPTFLLEIRVIIKISKKILLSHKLWLIWIRMKQFFFFFFWKKKFKMADSKKLSFSTTPKSWAIDTKISQIGPWVSRIDWCEGHQCDSTYMAVRLSNVSPK